MRSVVERNVVIRRISVLWHANLTSRLQTANPVQYEHTIFQDIIYNGTSTDTVQVHKSNIVLYLIRKLLALFAAFFQHAGADPRSGRGRNSLNCQRIQSALLSQNTALSLSLSASFVFTHSMHVACSYFHYFLHKTHINININIFATNNVKHKSDIPGIS